MDTPSPTWATLCRTTGFCTQGTGRGGWRLAPAFDINPFPDNDRGSRTRLSVETGPIDSLPLLMSHADYFGLGAPVAAQAALAQVVTDVSDWRRTAVAPDLGLTREDLDNFASAFEHEALEDAHRALQQPMRPRRAAMQMHRTEAHACPSNGTTLSHGAGRATGSFAGTQWLACGHGWAHRPAATAPRRGRGPACDHHRSHKRTGGGW